MIIRREAVLCVQALRYGIEQGLFADALNRAQQLVSRLEQHIDYTCEDCDGIGTSTDGPRRTPCATCRGTGVAVTYGDARLFFCAPEQVVTGDPAGS